MLAAIVLAAGDSVRMGTPKALLPDREGRPFVVRVVGTFFAAGLADVIVVTGARHQEVAGALEQDPVAARARVVRNPDPSRGQVSSLWVGLESVSPPELEAVLMTLVDVPMVQVATVRAVIDAWRRSRAPIVRPAIGKRHGHPVLFDRALFEELRHAPLDEGAKAVVHAHAGELIDVEVDDEGSVIDVDTPRDYEQLFGK